MNRSGSALFDAPLAHEHTSHCNCRECRSNFAQAFAPVWAEREWEATATNNIVFGLDTASVGGNKNPNWVQAKAKGSISFAIIRSNYGIWEDPVFKRDWPKMKGAGIVRGAYLFLRFPHPKYGMKAPDPVSQAKAFIKTVGHLNESDFPPSLDVEFPGGRKVTGMSEKHVLDGVRAAWKVLRAHYGVAPIIYTSARVWKEDLHNLSAPDLV
jgi:GH25 family lysozyme M1 (1,4-beta-N-acetylmuramidase)